MAEVGGTGESELEQIIAENAKAELDSKMAAFDAWRNKVAGVTEVPYFKNRVIGGRGYMLKDNTLAGLGKEEWNTLTCRHCQNVKMLDMHGRIIHGTVYKTAEGGRPVAFKPNGKWSEPGYCAKCNSKLCEDPICSKFCTPIAKRIDINLDFLDNPETHQEDIEKRIY